MAKFKSLNTLSPVNTDGADDNSNNPSGDSTSGPSGDSSPSGSAIDGISVSGGQSGGTSEHPGSEAAEHAAGDGSGTGDGGSGDSNSREPTDSDEFDGFSIDGINVSGRANPRPATGSGDPTPVTGQAGRHKRKECPCQKCTEWRRVSGVALQVDDGTPAPQRVNFDTLRSKGKSFAKDTSKKMLGIGISTLFAVPHMMLPTGTADHWPLNDDEERALVERLDAVLDMMPKRTKQRGLDAIAKIAPPIALIVTAFMVTKPRIDLTRLQMAQRARQPTPRQHVPQPHTEAPADNVRDISTARSASATVQFEGSSTGIDEGSLARRATIVPPDSAALSDPAF